MYSRNRLLLLALFLLSCLLVLGRLGSSHLEMFDESRRAVSALEMALGESHPLVPTYGGEPDHWGTKPPLLIWLQAATVTLFGPSEFSIRLPSALASVALFLLLIWWGRRDWGGGLAGTVAALTVCANAYYMDNHGARSGDYDALLLLFLTAQLVAVYRRRYGWLAVGLLLAGWTKGIAGCLFLPGIAGWLLLDPAARRELRRPGLYVSVLAGLLGIAAYYLLRESVDPGYLRRVMGNELGGRFLTVNEGHQQPWYHYLRLLFLEGGFGVLAALGVVGLGRAVRQTGPALLVSCTAAAYLFVITLSATKLFWYQSPLLPLLGLGLGHLLLWFGRRPGMSAGLTVAVGTAMFLPFVADGLDRIRNPEARLGTERYRLLYREFLADPKVEPPYLVAVPAYHAAARWEVTRLRYRGEEVGLINTRPFTVPGTTRTAAVDTLRVGQHVVVCENAAWKDLAGGYEWTDHYRAGACKVISPWRVH